MKISKLFHWLYALVMLLPIFAIGVTCGYAMFNKNAYQSYSDKYVETTQEITNYSQFVSGNNYIAKYKSVENPSQIYGAWVNYNSISIEWEDYGFENHSYNQFRLFNNGLIQLKDVNDNQYQKASIWGNTLNEFTFNLNSIQNESLFNGGVTYIGLFYTMNSLSDVFYYSIDKVKESPVFSWAYNSFLVTPFSYIVNLFSMPTNSIVVLLLSYWLTISICWLVFDLVMYVPMLVHRWLDKGVLE